MNDTDFVPALSREHRPFWKYLEALAPAILVWVILIGALFVLFLRQTNRSDAADRELLREWIDETRIFRKTLPELADEYAEEANEAARLLKRAELLAQMESLAEPTRVYPNQLPGIPILYQLSVHADGCEPVVWSSPLPRPKKENDYRVWSYRSGKADGAIIRIEYQLHTLGTLRREKERFNANAIAAILLTLVSTLASVFVVRFLRRERRRDTQRLTQLAEAEHRERELLETRFRGQQAERATEEVKRKLLQEQVEKAELRHRADDAEKAALEMKSQLYAGIGIMAGSYAHNIKNLLVRPNDLLARCLEADGLPVAQTKMLGEVRSTLGTVTERLQEILRTIRRDPKTAELAELDLAALLRETSSTWRELAADKWKLNLVVTASGPPFIQGDRSHLQQAIENLVFNARDATFEERNARRDAVRRETTADGDDRRRRLIEAAGWRGEVTLLLKGEAEFVDLIVTDNGIGMTDEVRENCLQTHFTTKRNNALYEGHAAGMGLGLSFVSVVLEHHRAELTITSAPRAGTTFRIRFPATSSRSAAGPELPTPR